MSSKCILCQSDNINHYYFQKVFSRNFYKCQNCYLIFVDRLELINKSEEKSRYDNHNNSVRTSGYEKFLRRLISATKDYKSPLDYGLDFGQGPYPMLIELLKEDGYRNINGYDPIYNKDLSLLDNKYDYITCCEVVEHFSNPLQEFKLLSSLLKPNGIIVISTGIYSNNTEFADWYYIKDDTHINIFTSKTLEWLGNHLKLQILDLKKDLIVYQKR